MIIEFCVRNYLSFKNEMKLSFLATTLRESLSEPNTSFNVSHTGMSLLRSAVIYGANASGKTNVLKAIAFYRNFIMASFKDSQVGQAIDVENFRLNASTVQEPTTMEATFTNSEYIYRYGFEIDTRCVRTEWFYRRACKKRAKEVELFYREDGQISVHPKSPLLQELVSKKMVRDNALLLSTAAQFNEENAVAILSLLGDMQVIFGHEDEKLWQDAVKRLGDDQFCRRITEFASYADLGIESISKIDNRIVSNHHRYDNDGQVAGSVPFAFNSNESEGTIKYVALSYPIINALDNGKPLIIDELDSKLHPLLVRKIITLFNAPDTNPKGAQLLFTTHDTFLISAGLFRRDQIWFTQKDSFGATELYSLAEYKVRGGSPYEKEYLQGKYGAIPIIGEMETIFNVKR